MGFNSGFKGLKRVPMAQKSHFVHSSSSKFCISRQCMIIKTGAVGNETKCSTEAHCSSVTWTKWLCG